MSNANTLVCRGFLNEVTHVAGSEGKDDKYFAKVAYSIGKKPNRKTQYLSLYVSKPLHGLAKAAYKAQTEDGEGRVVNPLGSQVATITVADPFFSVNDKGYIDSTGILTDISFNTPELKPSTSDK